MCSPSPSSPPTPPNGITWSPKSPPPSPRPELQDKQPQLSTMDRRASLTSQSQRILRAAAGAERGAPKPRRGSEVGAKAAPTPRRTATNAAAKGAPGPRGPGPLAARQGAKAPQGGGRPTTKPGPSNRADPCARGDPYAAERIRSCPSAKLIGQEHAWYADKVSEEDCGKDNGEAIGTEAMADAALHKSTALLKQLASLQLDLDGESDGAMNFSESGLLTPTSRWPRGAELPDDLSEAGSNEQQQEMAAIWRCLRDLEERLDRGGELLGREALAEALLPFGETFLDGVATTGSQATLRSPMASPRAANSLTNTWTSLPWSVSGLSTPPTSPSARLLQGRGAISTGSLAKTARAAACSNHPGSPRQISMHSMLGVPSSPCLSLNAPVAGLAACPSSPDVFRTSSVPVLTSPVLTSAQGVCSPQATLGLVRHHAWPTSPTASGMLTMIRTASTHQSSAPKLSL